jgi:cell division protease FtsH
MAAEQEVFNVVTTGAENDLEMVTRIARSMVGRWGMSERIGTLSVLPAEGDPRMAGVSDGLLDAVDEEVRRITEECYAEARRLLREHRDKLDAIVARLLEQRPSTSRRFTPLHICQARLPPPSAPAPA